MKMLAVVTILQVGGGWSLYPPISLAQTSGDKLSPALRACILTNAPAVEQTFTSLNEGVDFLTQKLCANEAAQQQADENKVSQMAMQKRMEAACKAAREKPADAGSSENGIAFMCDNPLLDPSYMDDEGESVSRIIIGNYTIAGATSLAAQTLLKLRLARQKKP